MMWHCMMWDGVGYACKIDGRVDGEPYTQILQDEFQKALPTMARIPPLSTSSRTMTLTISPRWPEFGLKIMTSKSFHGQHHLQTSIQLNISGLISREGWLIMGFPPKGILKLWDRVQEEWDKIGPEVCQNSML